MVLFILWFHDFSPEIFCFLSDSLTRKEWYRCSWTRNFHHLEFSSSLYFSTDGGIEKILPHISDTNCRSIIKRETNIIIDLISKTIPYFLNNWGDVLVFRIILLIGEFLEGMTKIKSGWSDREGHKIIYTRDVTDKTFSRSISSSKLRTLILCSVCFLVLK